MEEKDFVKIQFDIKNDKINIIEGTTIGIIIGLLFIFGALVTTALLF